MLVWPILWRDAHSLSPATWFIAHKWHRLESLPWSQAAWTLKGSWSRSGRLVRELGGEQVPSLHSCVWIFNSRSYMTNNKPQEFPSVEMMGLACGSQGWVSIVSWVGQLISSSSHVLYSFHLFLSTSFCSERAFEEELGLPNYWIPWTEVEYLASAMPWSSERG